MKAMLKLKRFRETSFRTVAIAAIGAAALVLAVSLPFLDGYLKQQALEMYNQAKRVEASDNRRALLYFRLANILRPADITIGTELSRRLVATGATEDAIKVLRPLPAQTSLPQIAALQLTLDQPDQALATIETLLGDLPPQPEWLALKAKALVELERFDEASEAVSQAGSFALNDQDYVHLHGLVLLHRGDPDKLEPWIASQSSSEARSAVQNAKASHIAIAKLLYAQQLLRSSQRELAKVSDKHSSEYHELSAEVLLSAPNTTPSQLANLRAQLIARLAHDPANPRLRQLLSQVMVRQGDTAGAGTQENLAKRLESGSF